MNESPAPPAAKRPCLQNDSMLVEVLQAGQWVEAQRLVKTARIPFQTDPSPLALACRLGAPYECVKAILDADPAKLRHVLDARGTPLHEAIVCESVGPRVIQALLDADEALSTTSGADTGNDTLRAALLQDVDGFTPLHLLIRRRFQSHMMDVCAAAYMQNISSDSDTSTGTNGSCASSFMPIMEMLVKSCPDSVTIPDRGEYEEPPIVYAIKANIYSPIIGDTEDEESSVVERQIYHMVQCLLRYCPRAATCVFQGYRGKYTALHSAVFHGRHSSTIRLILKHHHRDSNSSDGTDDDNSQSSSAAALLANTQGELPLHFCAMRGEPPQSVRLIARVAPQAVVKRDSAGLTPVHWLWIRFMSTLPLLATQEEDDEINNDDEDNLELIPTSRNRQAPSTSDEDDAYDALLQRYADFTTCLEQQDFDADLHLIRHMDTPVDFLRMRHIPLHVLTNPQQAMHWAQRTVQILQHVRERHQKYVANTENNLQGEHPERGILWNRQQVVVSLFWTKVVSLLTIAISSSPNDHHQGASPHCIQGPSVLVHRAFATPSCPPWVALICAKLYPQELNVQCDGKGRLPIHYAASRAWHARDCSSRSLTASRTTSDTDSSADANDDTVSDGDDPYAAKLLFLESLTVLQTALDLSDPKCVRIADNDGRLVLHHAIDTVCQALPIHAFAMKEVLAVLRQLVRIYPESLQMRDGISTLPPFLQATAAASTSNDSARSSGNHAIAAQREKLSLSITFELLREDPTLLVSDG